VHSGVVLPASWAFYLFVAWGVLTIVAVGRIAFGLLRIRELRKTSTEIPVSDLAPQLRGRLEQKYCRRKITLCQNEQVRVPVAIGFFHPAVILPLWALKEMSTTELDAALLHEIAHLRRWDDITNVVQKVLGAFLFFHPAVWWIEKRLALNREMACDDVVLGETSNPREYANCLISLAEKSFFRRGIALAQAAVSHVRQTRLRVLQILNTDGPAVTTVWKPALALMTAFSMLSVSAVNWIPQMVSFRQAVPALVGDSNRRGSNRVDVARQSQPQTPANASARIVQTSARARKQKSASDVGAAVVPAKLLRQPQPQPRVQLAQARRAEPLQQSTSYVVIMQTHYTPAGAVFWSIDVVHLTVFHPNPRAQEQPPAKSI
jgi:hypothetical protein